MRALVKGYNHPSTEVGRRHGEADMVLMNLLPGLRELRAPLVSGYLWLISAWLFLGHRDWLPTRPSDHGEVARLWDLGDTLGKTVVLAAVSFIAYLIGSFLEMDPDGRMAAFLAPLVLADRRPFYLKRAWHEWAKPAKDLLPDMKIDLKERKTTELRGSW